MSLREKSVIIRPELAAPEVDEYDEVRRLDINAGDIAIGAYVEYTLSSDVSHHEQSQKNPFSH